VVDCGFRGEWTVVLHNLSGSTFYYKAGDRIAQVLFLPVPAVEVCAIQNLSPSARGEGGYGSTGQ
jgi:dUTP pyrophosphatase